MSRCDGEREACKRDNGPWLAAACAACPRHRSAASPYVLGLLRLRLMRLGGYPFGAEDLPLSTWADLGVLENVIQSKTPKLL